MDYKACWDYQELLFNQTIQQKILNRNLPITENVVTKNYLLFVEHPNVFTLGKSGNEKNLLLTTAQLSEKKTDYYNHLC
jgi:lipoyl(octanoyl) transferase